MRKIWIATLAAALLASSPALAINTHTVWDGSNTIGYFGCNPYYWTPTYGQTITVSKFRSTIGRFTFFVTNQSGLDSSMVVRAEIYQWDPVNHMATGNALYESEPRTFAIKPDNLFYPETFQANIAVTPGAQYVLFLTTDKDLGQCGNPLYRLNWAWISDDVYSKGTFVDMNDNGDTSLWTTQSWAYAGDLAFKATMPSP